MKKDEAYYFYLETEILALRDSIIPLFSKEDLFLLEENFKHVDEFIYVGEYGLAFEGVCYVIQEAKIILPSKFKQKIFTLGTLMDIEEEKWTDIQYTDADDLKKESG